MSLPRWRLGLPERWGRLRELRHAVDLMNAPEEGAWRVQLTGTAVLTEGEFRAIDLAAAD